MEERAEEVELEAWLKRAKRICVAGVGNPYRGDDFVGMKIVRDLKGKVPGNVFLVECETVPEMFIEEILDFNPSHILIIDAAMLGSSPGSSKLVIEIRADLPSISTHVLPLHIFCNYLKGASKAEFALLAIQPEKTDYGEGLTKDVGDSAIKLVEILRKILTTK